jgi:probable phosphoglycerate mutase
VVRHGEPEFPHEHRRFLGQSDPPLSAAGVEQAHRLAEQLRGVGFDSIHSSDLQRCLCTARVIAAQTTPQGGVAAQVITDQRLREIDCGEWEGLTQEEAAARNPTEYRERERDVVGSPFPGGESFLDLRARVLPALQQVLDQGGANALVVTHLGVIRVLVCEYGGVPLTDLFSFKLEHGGVILLRSEPRPMGAGMLRVSGSVNNSHWNLGGVKAEA